VDWAHFPGKLIEGTLGSRDEFSTSGCANVGAKLFGHLFPYTLGFKDMQSCFDDVDVNASRYCEQIVGNENASLQIEGH
jgi:hypothetical protein